MATIKGKGIRVEVAAVYAAAVAITEISNAYPAVATRNAHGFTNGACGYLVNMDGMAELEGQAVRLKNVTANTFELQGIDTTDMGDFNAGSFVLASDWKTLAEATGHDIGGGGNEKLDETCLIHTTNQESQGNAAAQNVSVPILAQDVPSVAGDLIERTAARGGSLVVRTTLATGALRLFRGEPGLGGESIQRKAIATGNLDFAVKGRTLKLPA